MCERVNVNGRVRFWLHVYRKLPIAFESPFYELFLPSFSIKYQLHETGLFLCLEDLGNSAWRNVLLLFIILLFFSFNDYFYFVSFVVFFF